MSEENKVNDVEAMAAALKKANEEAKNYRLQFKEASEKIEKLSGFRTDALKSRAELILTQRGVKNPERLISYINFDEVEPDGIEDAVSGLEEALPEIFDPKLRAGSIEPGDKKVGATEKSATDLLVKQIMKR